MSTHDSGRAMWVAVSVGLAGGLALFLYGYAAHVAPYFPRYFDQLSEYAGLYRVHYALADASQALTTRFGTVSLVLMDMRGWAVPWIATALGFAFGANRLAFASANYVFFAAIVVALAAAMRRRCDAWTAGTAIGLMLTSRSIFLATGGVHDLRLDFVGLAMFGIFVLALWRMAETPDRRRVVLAALAYAASLWSRSITGVYGLVTIATFGAAALALMALGRDPAWRARWRAALALGLVAGPIFAVYVAVHYREIDSYYFNLLRTDEIRIRLAEYNLTSRAELLGFFLRSAWFHFRPLVLWFAATFGLAAVSWAIAWRHSGALARVAPMPYGPAAAALGAAFVGVILPLSVFSTSSVVIGILTVPLAAGGAFVIAAARSALQSEAGPSHTGPWPAIGKAIALVPLAAGLWICGRAFLMPPVWDAADIPMARAHNALFETIAVDGPGTIAWMTVSEGANWAGFSVHLYESGRASAVGAFRHTETAIFAMDADAARTRIAEADGVVTWRRFPAQYPYPAITSLRDTQAQWQPILDRDFALRTELAMPGGTIAYYRRAAPR